jgi:pheromone shutdown protein TraB
MANTIIIGKKLLLLLAIAHFSQGERSGSHKNVFVRSKPKVHERDRRLHHFYGLFSRGGSSQVPVKEPSTGKEGYENEQVETNSLEEREEGEEEWRSCLPPQLKKRRGSLYKILVPTGLRSNNSNHNQSFTANDVNCELYLLGTAHVSKDSCEDARLLMERIKPDVLFIELCNQRVGILDDDEQVEIVPENNDGSKSVSQMAKEVIEHNPGMSRTAALSSVLLSKIQGDYATKLGVKIGGEFQEAFRIAKIQQKEFSLNRQMMQWGRQPSVVDGEPNDGYLHGCAVVLGDRPVRLTLLRTWESLSLFGKLKLVFALIISSLKQPNEQELKEWIESIMNDPNNDILSKSIEELSRHFPTVKETIIAERDRFMACKILQTAKVLGEASLQDGKMRRIVAIVGAGHCPGIRGHLTGQSDITKNIEATLREVIETKRHKVDNNTEMLSIISDISSIDII